MRPDFDPARLYHRLPYGTTVPSRCLGMMSYNFDCRVDPAWLESNLKNTPFLPASDRVIVSASDYSNNAVVPFKDVMVMASVEYKGKIGGHPIVEFEGFNRVVMGGREKWGYPKLCADIAFNRHENGGAEIKVKMGSSTVMEMVWQPDTNAIAPKSAPKTSPHYLLRMLPSPSQVGMSFAEILERDSSTELKIHKEELGSGTLSFGAWPEHELDYSNLAGFALKEIISAKRSTMDWHMTEQNGWAKVIERIL